MRSIATPNVLLVPQVADHADEMFRVLGDPAIYEYENEPPCSVEWLRECFTRLETAEACQAVIAELAKHYGVVTVYAIFKRRNLRSARLLERLGFSPAASGADVEPDEMLMLRALNGPE